MLATNPTCINDPVNLNKDTLLHFAVYHKKTMVVNFLIEQGADKNQKNNFGITPMDLVNRNVNEINE